MARYFKVRNLEKFQNYKDRNPPWIKLHMILLDNYEFGCLHDASKWHLCAIWMLASRTGNKFPWDPGWITKKVQSSETVNLEQLEKLGFIESYEDDCMMQASCKQNGVPETETETETETEQRRKDSRSKSASSVTEGFQKFWEAYPKKRSKGQAERAWLKIKPDEQLQGQILAALERAKTSVWSAKEKRYIQHPATWLNAKGWLDELEPDHEVKNGTDRNGCPQPISKERARINRNFEALRRFGERHGVFESDGVHEGNRNADGGFPTPGPSGRDPGDLEKDLEILER